jgi:Ca2+-binding RTX toxin-like protein
MANITGTQFNDTIHMAGDGVSVGGTEFNTVTTGADTINAGAGNDVVYANAGADTVDAGTGDDFVNAGSGNDIVDGGDGNDVIVGGQGADNLTGGVGNDTFQIQGISDISGLAETVNGGSDVDTLDFQAFGAFGAVNLASATIISVERIFLSNNDVTLTAAQLGAFETLSAGGAVDRFFLSAAGTVDLTDASIIGIDEFRGTAGADTFIFSGVSNGQFVNALAGVDTLTGSEGNDTLDGGADNDTITGGQGGDSLIGGDGVDHLNGESGNDIINGGAGSDIMAGTVGNDTFRIGFVAEISGLAETVSGGLDIDRLDFQALGATGAVNLTLATLSSIEELALAGNDVTLTAAQLGAFTLLTAGGNADRLILSAAGTADLTNANISGIDEFRGSTGADTINLTNVANSQFIDGRAGNDILTGGFGADTLGGDIGTDTINGGDGNDAIRGGQNADTLNGGVGYDVFQVQQISDISGLAETLNGGNDLDRLDFQVFNAFGAVDLTTVTFVGVEQMTLSANDVTLTAAQLGAFESITAGGNLDRLIISAAGTTDLTGATITGIDEIRGSNDADVIIVKNVATAQTVNGLLGNDKLLGGEAGDLLAGNEGDDTLYGYAGNDTMTGGLGKDGLIGGDGNDSFVYTHANDSLAGTNRDGIVDFVHGDDIINLSGVDANTNVGGDQAFAFIAGAAFGNVAGQLRYDGTNLLGDLNGDSVADFQIALTGSPIVTASDLVL